MCKMGTEIVRIEIGTPFSSNNDPFSHENIVFTIAMMAFFHSSISRVGACISGRS